MKKLFVISLIGLLMLGLSLTQVGIAQSNDPTPQDLESQISVNEEIQLLKLINQAGLTNEQLMQVQSLLSELREAQQTLLQRQQELKSFLLSWEGAVDEFSIALEPYEEEVQRAHENLQQTHQMFFSQLKNQLSYQQGETLFEGLRQMMPSASAMSMPLGMMEGMGMNMPSSMQGMSDDHQMAQQEMMENQNHNQHHQSQGQAMSMDAQGMVKMQHLDLLERVISEKLSS